MQTAGLFAHDWLGVKRMSSLQTRRLVFNTAIADAATDLMSFVLRSAGRALPDDQFDFVVIGKAVEGPPQSDSMREFAVPALYYNRGIGSPQHLGTVLDAVALELEELGDLTGQTTIIVSWVDHSLSPFITDLIEFARDNWDARFPGASLPQPEEDENYGLPKPSDRLIAELYAQGMTDREIGEQLGTDGQLDVKRVRQTISNRISKVLRPVRPDLFPNRDSPEYRDLVRSTAEIGNSSNVKR